MSFAFSLIAAPTALLLNAISLSFATKRRSRLIDTTCLVVANPLKFALAHLTAR